MQSGRAKNRWLVEISEEENLYHLDKLMGWVSVDNTNSQLQFEFASKEEAVDFAKKNDFEYEVKEPKIASVKKKSYASNFV